jgi:hypothetical protein
VLYRHGKNYSRKEGADIIIKKQIDHSFIPLVNLNVIDAMAIKAIFMATWTWISLLHIGLQYSLGYLKSWTVFLTIAKL